jgi:hypothetical protein
MQGAEFAPNAQQTLGAYAFDMVFASFRCYTAKPEGTPLTLFPLVG